jgi:hypothetical protein
MHERPSAPPAHPKRHWYNTASPTTFQAEDSRVPFLPALTSLVDIGANKMQLFLHCQQPGTRIRFSTLQFGSTRQPAIVSFAAFPGFRTSSMAEEYHATSDCFRSLMGNAHPHWH